MAIYLVLVGMGVGLFLLIAALFNWDSVFVDPESRVVELLGGERALRWFWGLAGVAAIAMTLFLWAKG